jgi:hypothetical protein
MRLPGGRQAQPGVSTRQSVLAWRLEYAEVLPRDNCQIKSRSLNPALLCSYALLYPMQKLHQGMSNLQYHRAASVMGPNNVSAKVI